MTVWGYVWIGGAAWLLGYRVLGPLAVWALGL